VRKQTSYVVEEALAEPSEELPVKFSVQPSSLNVSLPPGAKRFFILEVLSREEVPIKVQPNQEQKLKLSITVPERVQGKYYAQLMIEASFLPSEEEKAEGVAKVNISVSIPENLKR